MEHKPKVLIIEDNPINVIVTKKFIEDICQADTATNAQTALQKLSENKYDVVLTDLNLGHDQMTGMDILTAIRQDEQLQNIPVVAITAYSENLEETENHEVQFTKILSKPISKDALIETLKEFLNPE